MALFTEGNPDYGMNSLCSSILPLEFTTHQAPSEKGSTLKGNDLPAREANPFRLDPFSEGIQ